MVLQQIMGFGTRLMLIRKEKNLSQTKLAKMVGVHPNVLGRYEREEARPFVEMAMQLANALEVSLDYLVGTAEMELDAATVKRLEEMAKLPPEAKSQIFMVMDALIRDFKARQTYMV